MKERKINALFSLSISFPRTEVGGYQVSGAPFFYSIHQSNNKEGILLEAVVSVKSPITEERELMSKRKKAGTRMKELDRDIADRR